MKKLTFLCSSLAMLLSLPLMAQDQVLQKPDGKAADMSKPVQVYICMGQSNMLGFGKPNGNSDGSLEYAVKNKNLYPHLVDADGKWTTRKDVRYVFTMGSGNRRGGIKKNEWLTVNGKFGPEIGIGHHLGQATDAPVLILKSCIGNRSLGWDILPPGQKQYEYKGKVYPGYKGSPENWEVGTTPKPIGWYAGMQYDGDVANAKRVLEEIGKYYPGATKFEVAGFFWWQGDKDRRNEAHAMKYEENLVALIKQLRKEFNAPNAKFVCATLGQTKKDATGKEGMVIKGMFAVDGENGKYSEFKGNVATVYTHPVSKGSDSGSHYGGNAETYMNVGNLMGSAMVKLLQQ